MAVTVNASTSSGLVWSSDLSGAIQLQNNGSTKLTVDSTGAYGQLVQGTVQNTTSGTAIDFTGIPSWAKRVTVVFNSVSTNNTSGWLLQIGSGSIVTTGYTSGTLSTQSAASGSAAGTSTVGFLINNAIVATYLFTGTVQLINITGNTWIASGLLVSTSGDRGAQSGGTLTLSGSLDRLRITSVTPDTFDNGSINLLYEG
jgi:hypothetical protein